MQPFFVGPRGRIAQQAIGRSVVERIILETGQRLQRFPRVEADSGVGIGQAVNEVRIKPIAASDFLRRFPAKTPGHEDALTSITLHDPPDPRSDGLIVWRQLRGGLAIPIVKFLRSPCERLIEMTKVAGIGSSIGDAFLYARRRDLMAAHRVQQAKCRAWHVTVVTAAPG